MTLDEFLKHNNLTEEDVSNENFLQKVPIFKRLKNKSDKDKLAREFLVGKDDVTIFSHAKQALRFLCFFEGKRVTAQTMFGIINHNYDDASYGKGIVNLEIEIQRVKDKNPLRNVIHTNKSREIYLCNQEHDSLEAQVVKFADFLSFSIHDLDDGLRAGKLSLNELKEMFLKAFPKKEFAQYFVGSQRYTRFIIDYIKRNREIISGGGNKLEIPEESHLILSWIIDEVIRPKIHLDPEVARKNEEGKRYIDGLYDIWNTDYKSIEREFPNLGYSERKTLFKPQRSSLRVFCDFISTLTDNEIIKVYRRFYGPEK